VFVWGSSWSCIDVCVLLALIAFSPCLCSLYFGEVLYLECVGCENVSRPPEPKLATLVLPQFLQYTFKSKVEWRTLNSVHTSFIIKENQTNQPYKMQPNQQVIHKKIN
jgi:hypothetical protein